MKKVLSLFCLVLSIGASAGAKAAPNFNGDLSGWTTLRNDPLGDMRKSGLPTDMIQYGAAVMESGGVRYLYLAWKLDKATMGASDVTSLNYFINGNESVEAYFESVINVDRRGGPNNTPSSLYPDPYGDFYWYEWEDNTDGDETGGRSGDSFIRSDNDYGRAEPFEGGDIDIQWGIPYDDVAGSNNRGLGFFGDGVSPGWLDSDPENPTALHDDLRAIGYRYFDSRSAANDHVISGCPGLHTCGPLQPDGKGLVAYDPDNFAVEVRIPIRDIVDNVSTYADGIHATGTWEVGLRVNTANPGEWMGDQSGNGMSDNASAGIISVQIALPGDANYDGVVGFEDFRALQNSYGQSGKHWDEGDFNDDGRVTFEDFAALQNNYGRSLDSAAPGPDADNVLASSLGCSPLGLVLLAAMGLGLLSLKGPHQDV